MKLALPALPPRAKIGVLALAIAGVGAAAWFLYVEDWLRGTPPAPVAKAAPKPAAAPAKPAAPAPGAPATAAVPAKPAPAAAPTASAAPPASAAPAAATKPAVVAVAAAAPAPAAAAPAAPAPAAMESKEKPKPSAKERAKPVAKEPELAPIPVVDLTAKPADAPADAPAAPVAPKVAPPADLVPKVILAGPVVAGPKFNDVMTAVIYRDAAAVNDLIAYGKWADRADSQGNTPLMVAVTLGDAPIAEALLKAGANPDRAMAVARERKDAALTSLLERYRATSTRP